MNSWPSNPKPTHSSNHLYLGLFGNKLLSQRAKKNCTCYSHQTGLSLCYQGQFVLLSMTHLPSTEWKPGAKGACMQLCHRWQFKLLKIAELPSTAGQVVIPRTWERLTCSVLLFFRKMISELQLRWSSYCFKDDSDLYNFVIDFVTWLKLYLFWWCSWSSRSYISLNSLSFCLILRRTTKPTHNSINLLY